MRCCQFSRVNRQFEQFNRFSQISLTKSPVQPPHPPVLIHKHHSKLRLQAWDNSEAPARRIPALRRTAMPPAHRLRTPSLCLRIPSHLLGHEPSHIAVTATAAIANTIKVPCSNSFRPWGGNDALPEVLGAQECITAPWGRVRTVSSVAARGRKGELTLLGSKGPL